MFTCKNKLWLENISELFCSVDIIPTANKTLENQMNTISRLIMIISLILYLLKFKHSFLFLLLSLVFVIILYYTQKKTMLQTENYKSPQYNNNLKIVTCAKPPESNSENNTLYMKGGQIRLDPPSSKRFYNDDVPLSFNDPNYISNNKILSGPANPKTNIPPVIIPPPADLDYWKANNLVRHSAINSESQQEAYQSGFQVTLCDGSYDKNYNNNNNSINVENFELNTNTNNKICKNNFDYINTNCGYNASQIKFGLPSNFPSGKCEQDSKYTTYNENLFTEIIEPGIYSRNQINEPINSNIGISFDQQFGPVTKQKDKNGILYIEHDPNVIEPSVLEPYVQTINESNVYDPRFSGYGTSYRAYSDEITGQTRFMYDDINSIRMPNYITRSNIDNQPFANTYGPLQKSNYTNSDIRMLANNAYADSTMNFRTELQERLTRKIRANAWQQRKAPINKSNQFMGGGLSFRP